MAIDGKFEMTKAAELAFPPFLHERNFKFSKEGRFEISLLLPQDHPDLAAIKDLCVRIANEQQPGITKDPNAWKRPWRSADTLVDKPAANGKVYDNSHMAGKVLLTAHKPTPPKLALWDADRKAFVNHYEETERARIKDYFYAGCLVYCEFSFVWWSMGGIPTVTAYVNEVASCREGKKRGGDSRNAQEKWGHHVGHLSSVDPTAAGAEVDY